ncbi:MAG: L,D-transpeptidase family protein [Bacilli bacterium]|nr:L,D-transpeptidase family protein [Bacilli bacterium]
MKRIINITIIILVFFFVGMLNISAQELDCSIILKQGSKGENVRLLQNLLNQKENCALEVDGVYGKLTKSCVEQYQRNNNLSVDGIVGKNTCGSLTDTKISNEYQSSAIETYNTTKTPRAIVIEKEANVRASNTTTSRIISKVKLGNSVKIISEDSNWYKIKGSKNSIGYIRKDLVAKDCILVDISSQKLYVFENGIKKWSTNVVTGNKNVHDTPIGSYTLEKANLKKDKYLKGTNDDGSKYSSHVDYWMPFITDRGIGFHDASWREAEEFNSNTYNGNGSHGCVNMQHEAAEKLYNSITKDVSVVIRK